MILLIITKKKYYIRVVIYTGQVTIGIIKLILINVQKNKTEALNVIPKAKYKYILVE